jgi:hypothetical protein
MRLGLDERGVTEVMAAADHTRGLAKLAAGLRLAFEARADAPGGRDGGSGAGPIVPLVDEDADDRRGAIFGEIRAWARERLDVDRVPGLWRALAHHPAYLEAVWRREQTIMADGAVTRFQKQCIGYAMAVNSVSPYMIDYHAAQLRVLGLDAHGFIEALAVVDYFNNLNTLADGMDIESDIKPYLTYEPDASPKEQS